MDDIIYYILKTKVLRAGILFSNVYAQGSIIAVLYPYACISDLFLSSKFHLYEYYA